MRTSRVRSDGDVVADWETTAVVRCDGELDVASRPELRASLGQVTARRPDHVILDLGRVTFFDCSAIGEFVDARNDCRAWGGDLVVRDVSVFGRRVLTIVGLVELLADQSHPPDEPPDRDTSGGVVVDGLPASWETARATEHARGMIAGHFDVTVDEAAIMLRVFARTRQEPGAAVAAGVRDRTIDIADLARHRPAPDSLVLDNNLEVT